jgi:glycerol-3-phosphate acyltransferase PlsY
MIAWALFGYLLGSVPFAFLLARRAGIDVRVAGSGNVGAANVLRTTGTPLGVAVMALDISKGAAAVLMTHAAAAGLSAMALAGASAVVGHVYPVWLRFKGGKGVAVAAGVFAVLAPIATSAAALVFVVCVWASRIVSLGSVAATIALPSIAWWTGAPDVIVNTSAGCASLIMFRHRANIRRILMGTERRMRGRVA